MQQILIKKVSLDAKKLLRRPPSDDDATISVKPPCTLVDEETGEVIAIAIKGPSTRSLANKLKSVRLGNPIKGGRRLGGYSAGAATTFGFLPKRPIQSNCQACRSAAFYRDYPALADDLTLLGERAWKHLGELNPDRQKHLEECAKEIKSCWKIRGTAFTSGILNKNTPLRYHYDAGNYTDSWSAMLWITSGISGGALAIPAYNAKIVLEDGAWLFFSGQKLLHGVTPIKMLSKSSYRYSIVFYANMEMRNCGTIEEELVNAKKRRTDSESHERRVR